jgi:hypothetical protein
MKINTRTPLLQFQNPTDKLTDSLSAAVFVDDDLWVASDETTSVERLSTDDGLTFQHHKSFPLNAFIDLPAQGTEFDQEIDIEGIDSHDAHLWLVGSHSLKRKRVDRNDSGTDAKLIKKLGTVEREGNRFILARLPLVRNTETGKNDLDKTGSRLAGDAKSDALTDSIRKADGGVGDIHLGRFLDIPGKDNGFDVEGLAVSGEKVFVGLRGPVLRGWAVVLELSLDTSDSSHLVLKNFETGRAYRKHFLDLAGLGVRELCFHGADLLVLAGPTMNLDGPVILYRWKDALAGTVDSVVRGDKLVVELKLPFGEGADHAEGVALVPNAELPRQVLILYDSPGEERKKGVVDAIRGDVFDLKAH